MITRAPQPVTEPVTVDLSGTWRFTPGDAGDSVAIEVPGFWEAQGHLDLDGVATYRRDLDLPGVVEFATLEFDAVADLCHVFLNGEEVGAHEVGFTPFALDVSGRLSSGSNELAVEVVDPPRGSALHLGSVQGKQGWANEVFPSPPSVYLTVGGIWQPCRLVVHGSVYIEDVSCDMDPDEPTITVELSNRSGTPQTALVTVAAFDQTHDESIEIEAQSGTRVELSFSGRDAARWSPETPHLHEVRVDASVDGSTSHRRTLTTGLRSLTVEDGDLLIDGSLYRMRSALHQGFWPRGIYAADPESIDNDVSAALAAGLNTLRTHLKAFEPAWLDAADRAGLLLHCDTPIGEPVDPASFTPDSDYGRRCITAVREQIRRDRSRPSIVMWTLTNEVGLSHPGLVTSEGYRELIAALVREVRRWDPHRPIVENDWIVKPGELVSSDVRSPHWYGRSSGAFASELDRRLKDTASEKSPLYVTEFGEWGLPGPRDATEFFDNDHDLRERVAGTGWPGDYESFVRGTQVYQGWANRLQAERLRSGAHVKGFCLTEWTDVPHELNGLVSFRRESKRSIELFRPALADVAPIALLDRFSFAVGDPVSVCTFVSNWSADNLPAGQLIVRLAGQRVDIRVDAVPAGARSEDREVILVAPEAGRHELVLEAFGARVAYPLCVVGRPARRSVTVSRSVELDLALNEAGWSTENDAPLVFGEGSIAPNDVAEIKEIAASGRIVVALAQNEVVPLFGSVEPIPQTWGPTPFVFTTEPIAGIPAERVLAAEVFHRFPENYLAGQRGPLEVFMPPPFGRDGALVAVRRHGSGCVVACQLPIEDGLRRGESWELALLSELVAMGERS